jgi:hypothetical protein
LARHNLNRALEGQDLDYSFLNHALSTDAEPYLFKLVNSGTLPSELQENLEKLLICRSASFNSQESNVNSWLDTIVSSLRVQSLYDDNKSLFEKWKPEVLEPNGYYLGFKINNENIFCVPLEGWQVEEIID